MVELGSLNCQIQIQGSRVRIPGHDLDLLGNMIAILITSKKPNIHGMCKDAKLSSFFQAMLIYAYNESSSRVWYDYVFR